MWAVVTRLMMFADDPNLAHHVMSCGYIVHFRSRGQLEVCVSPST